MKNAMLKNALAEMRKTKSRFLSIFGIIAIGTGFFAGLMASEPDMKYSSDSYFDRANLMNYRIISTYGFDNEDIEYLEKIDGLNIYAGYFADAFIHTDDGDKVARVYSLDNLGENNEYNQLQLTEGRFPAREDECIVDAGKLVGGYNIGDKITLKGGSGVKLENSLSVTEYTVVGKYDNPMHISDTERGNTTIGNGSVSMTVYVPSDSFCVEFYTQVFVTADKLMGYNCYSEEYEKLSDEIMETLEQAAANRESGRYDSIKRDAQQQLNDAKQELEDKKAKAEQEISDNEKKLLDAKKELDEAKTQLDDAKAEIDKNKAKLDDAKRQLDDSKLVLDSTRALLSDSKKQLDEAKAPLDEAKKQLDDSKAQLDQAAAELAKAEKQINDGQAQIDEGRAQLRKGLSEGLIEMITSIDVKRYDEFIEEFSALLNEIAENSAEEREKIQEIIDILANVDSGADFILALMNIFSENSDYGSNLIEFLSRTVDRLLKLEEFIRELSESALLNPDTASKLIKAIGTMYEASKQLDEAQAQIDSARMQYEEGLAQYNDGVKQYEEGYAKYNEAYEQYSAGLAELNDGYAKYSEGLQQYNDGLAQYNDGVRQLNEGVEKYNDGYAEYENGLKQYEDGRKQLEDAKSEFNTQITDAQNQLSDAQREIDKLEKPIWYVYDRSGNPGYAEYGQNAERIKNIALVFPVFFVLVAALVCLTTMTRMVEEQRTQIGTLKALGYGNGAIIFKYLLYAVSASALGALFGTLIGLKMFPWIIITAYGMMYKIPDVVLPYNVPMITITVAGSAALVIATVYFACGAILKEQPAELMRPKAPKSGKTILLEKVGIIWKHLSFSMKVTFRNIFRYKRRMFMTIVGIAGCTALVLTGFGVYDSVNDILQKQFYEISTYTALSAHTEDMSEASREEVYDILEEYSCTYGDIYQKQLKVTTEGGSANAYIFGAKDSDTIEKFVNLKDRKSGEQYHVTNDGVIINEKLATLLGGVKVGDTVTLSISDTQKEDVTITAICENYANHYVYITEELYKRLVGDDMKYNCIFFNESNNNKFDESSRNELAERLMQVDGIMAVSFKNAVEGTFSDMLKSLNLVVVVLIVSAGLLAFIVLYNLTNININERIREIATLKVLGFYDGEVSIYVFRETLMLTALGTVAGLILGRVLVDFVVKTAEIDQVMFGREVHPLSFVLSVVITMIFALVVTLVMHKKLKNVVMVEALKSVE